MPYTANSDSFNVGFTGFGCEKVNQFNGYEQKPSSSVDEKVPLILSQGDKVHATRYSVRVFSRTEWDGTLSSKAFQPTPSDPCEGAGYHNNAEFSVGYLVSEGLIPSTPMDSSLMEELKGISQTKALADVRRSYNNVPLLIAERRETIQMIVKRARMLSRQGLAAQREALRKYFASPPKARNQVARDSANLHLEMLFGWLPVMGEIEGLCDQLAASESQKITGRGRMANDVSERTSWASPDDFHLRIQYRNYPVGYGLITDHKIRHSSRTSLTYSLDIEAAQRMRDNGFNPLATVYDLVPLSFLSDFISNLGQFLRAYDPLIGCTYITGSTSTWYEEELVRTVLPRSFVNPWGFRVTMNGRGVQTSRQLHVERFVHAAPPEPSFWFVNNLTLGKAATIAALAVQRYLKPLRRLVEVKQFRYRGPRPKYLPPINYRP